MCTLCLTEHILKILYFKKDSHRQYVSQVLHSLTRKEKHPEGIVRFGRNLVRMLANDGHVNVFICKELARLERAPEGVSGGISKTVKSNKTVS